MGVYWRGPVTAVTLGICGFAFLSGLLTSPVLAQTPPAPPVATQTDSLNREAERQRRRLEQRLDQRVPTIDGPVVEGAERPASEALESGGAKFKLNRVEFGDSSFISRSELSAISSRYVGREVDLSALYEIVAAINAIYVERGIITALATLPPQKIKGGLVKIKLTEGKLARSLVEGAKTLSPEYVTSRIDLPAGVVLDPHDLNRKITYFNRTNSAQIRALLQPGSSFGLTDIQYAVFEPAANTLQIYADNEGVESTGEYQIGGFFRRYGLLGMDDRLTVFATNARKTPNVNVAYNFPVDSIGSRLGVSYSRGAMAIVDGPFVDLSVEGKSQSGSLNYTRPVHVTSDWLVQASMSASVGESLTTYSDVDVTDTDTIDVAPGLSITYTRDRLTLQFAPSIAFVHSREKILQDTRNLPLFKGYGAVLFGMRYGLSLHSDFSWQWTGAELIPGGQLFQVGGPTTVRGYPSNAAAGDSGYLVNLELHRSLEEWREGLDVFAFVDQGGVFSTEPNFRPLTSIGAGLDLRINELTRLEVSIARPINDIITDQDQFQLYGRFAVTPEW